MFKRSIAKQHTLARKLVLHINVFAALTDCKAGQQTKRPHVIQT